MHLAPLARPRRSRLSSGRAKCGLSTALASSFPATLAWRSRSSAPSFPCRMCVYRQRRYALDEEQRRLTLSGAGFDRSKASFMSLRCACRWNGYYSWATILGRHMTGGSTSWTSRGLPTVSCPRLRLTGVRRRGRSASCSSSGTDFATDGYDRLFDGKSGSPRRVSVRVDAHSRLPVVADPLELPSIAKSDRRHRAGWHLDHPGRTTAGPSGPDRRGGAGRHAGGWGGKPQRRGHGGYCG